MMSVMKVCSRSQNSLYPGRSVKNASTGLSIGGCDFSGFVGVAERAFSPLEMLKFLVPFVAGGIGRSRSAKLR